MRIRRFLLAATIAGVAVFVAAAPASAEDPGKLHGEHLVHCVEEALHDNEEAIADEDYEGFEADLENCSKSKSIIAPAQAELIWGTVAFAVVAFVLVKFAFPMIRKSLADREEKIRGDLERAEQARTEAEEEKRQFEAQLGDARAEGNRIVEEAREAAEQVRRDVTARAESEAAEIRNRAQQDAQLATQRAMSDLQQRVGEISIELAEKIVERNLDRDTQMALVESYISSVGTDR
jgi:F-type H+-transporting ATPase subunit b